jgi:hypothetical protein
MFPLGRLRDGSAAPVEHNGDGAEPVRLDDNKLSSTLLTIKRDTKRCCNTNTFTYINIMPAIQDKTHILFSQKCHGICRKSQYS